MTLTELLRPWLAEHYADDLQLVRGLGWNGGYIRGDSLPSSGQAWPYTFAEVNNDGPYVKTFRSVRSKTRQKVRGGSFQYNFTPVYKKLQPSDPEFLQVLKHELDLMMMGHK